MRAKVERTGARGRRVDESGGHRTRTTCNKNARGNERGGRPFLAGANARKKQHMERVKRGIGGEFHVRDGERRVVAREGRRRDEW